MSLFDRLYQIFLSENAKKRFEKIILYFELFGIFNTFNFNILI